MSIQDFFNKWNNQGCDFDGYYGDQCVDIAQQYNKDVVGAPRLTGNAVDVWTTYPQGSYDKIPNTPAGIPSEGDIMIWGTSIGQYGHIAIFKEGDQNQFISFDQNWPLNSVCHFQPHNYSGVLGWLHPKGAVTTQPIAQPSEFNDQTKIPAAQLGWDSDLEIQQIRGLLGDLKVTQKQLKECQDKPTMPPSAPNPAPVSISQYSTSDLFSEVIKRIFGR